MPHATIPQDINYTTQEAAAILRCTPKTIRRAIIRDQITVMKFGKRILIPASSLHQFVTIPTRGGNTR